MYDELARTRSARAVSTCSHVALVASSHGLEGKSLGSADIPGEPGTAGWFRPMPAAIDSPTVIAATHKVHPLHAGGEYTRPSSPQPALFVSVDAGVLPR